MALCPIAIPSWRSRSKGKGPPRPWCLASNTVVGYLSLAMSHQPDNIFAGTQVVSLVEVRGTNDPRVHPRGAVGVVTRTPTGDQNQFLVRFPDGFEASFTREKLEVLKHFKDRLGAPVSDPARAGSEIGVPFDLESSIIYRCVVGSRAYGLDNDESDTDRRGTRSPCSHRSRRPNCN